MSFKWQDKHMELFLETYKQYECLWNNKCLNYSKSNARERAYLMMLNDLNIPGLTVADVKAKIKTIRTRYGAELAKIRSSESNADAGGEVYQPRLFWFKNADQFLRTVCSPKPTYLTPKFQDQKEICDEKVKNITQPFEDNESDSQEISISSPGTTSDTSRYPKNKLKRSFPSNFQHGAVKKLKQMPKEDEILVNKQIPDEFDYFCESLAIQLKRMPLKRAIICQEKLQHVMTQERLFQLSEQYLSSLPISMSSDDYHQQSLSVDTQNQSSDHNSIISSTGSRLESIIETHQYKIDGEEESENEGISKMKTEI